MELRSDVRSHQSIETIHFHHGAVQVTDARLVVENQTYPIAGITSIVHHETPPNRIPGMLLLMMGIIISAYSDFHVMGLIAAALGVAWIWRTKGDYSILIRTASGEARPISAPDRMFVRAVANALNQAIGRCVR